jgi:hypothetical protein
MNKVAVGNIRIKATKGAVGKAKKSLMPGMREALNEMREDILGIKPVPNASEPIQGI